MKKVNGGVQKGTFVERDVAFITLTFSADVSSSAFDIPESCVDNAVRKLVQRKATVLAVGELYAEGTKLDVMLGHANGFTADQEGFIFSGETVDGVESDLTTVVSATASAKFAHLSGLTEVALADLVPFEGKLFYKV